MTYTVMMIRFPNERVIPAYELGETFETREAAVAAAARELAARSFEASAGFQVFDENGQLVLAVPLGAATESTRTNRAA